MGKGNLSRRGFIGAAGGAAAAGAMGPFAGAAAAHGGGHGHGRGGDIPEDRIGMQLFTVRDLLADNELDLPGTFEVLADAGYALVEVGGSYDGRTAAEFRALAESVRAEAGGQPRPRRRRRRGGPTGRRSSPTPRRSACAGSGSPRRRPAPPQTHEAYAALAAEFNQWGAEARAQGLRFYFHNHPTDFALDAGTPIYDTLLAETDPKLVFFELDIAWIEAGGQSAYDYLREHGPQRFPLFHVKDLTWTDPWPATPPQAQAPRTTPANVNLPNRPYWLRDVGKGDLDFPRIFSALKDPRDHVYHVEHDDAGADETLDAAAPRPRNPAGSANTSWTSRKYLAELEIPRRRR